MMLSQTNYERNLVMNMKYLMNVLDSSRSLRQWAKEIGTSPANLTRLFKGDYNMSLRFAVRISEYFHVPLERLMTENLGGKHYGA